jgi:hypothetical protein
MNVFLEKDGVFLPNYNEIKLEQSQKKIFIQCINLKQKKI